jgi:hypothetical protein
LGNKHLLEAGKAIHVKAGRARKGTERKMDNMHLLNHGRLYLNTMKKSEKGREVEESDGKKDMQYAFIRNKGGCT